MSRGNKDGGDARLLGGGHKRGAFPHRHVGDEHTVGARRRELPIEVIQPLTEGHIPVNEQANGDVGELRPHLRNEGNRARHRGPVVERPQVGFLDRGAVSHRI